MVTPDEIRQALLVDEKELQRETLAALRRHLRVDSTGNAIILEPGKYIARDAIALLLLGRHFARQAGLCASDALEVGVIAESLGLDANVAAARLADLRKDGWVDQQARGIYRIVAPRAGLIMGSIDARASSGPKGGMHDKE